TDVWAFGAVLFEMLTGHAAFARETVTDVLGAIVHKEPDWSALPAGLPAPIHRLLRRCLTKDVRQRLHDIADARLDIDSALTEPVEQKIETPVAASVPKWASPRSLVAALIGAFIIGG